MQIIDWKPLAGEPFIEKPGASDIDAARLSCDQFGEFRRDAPAAEQLAYHAQIDAFMEANKRFHLTIVEAAGNERLRRTLSGLIDEMSRLVALGFNVQGIKPEIKNDHNALIEAFEQGDARRVETISRRHIETFKQQTLEKVYASLSEARATLPTRGDGVHERVVA